MDQKIGESEKKGGDLGAWLDKLSRAERETAWQRFSCPRQSDPEIAKNYKLSLLIFYHCYCYSYYSSYYYNYNYYYCYYHKLAGRSHWHLSF